MQTGPFRDCGANGSAADNADSFERQMPANSKIIQKGQPGSVRQFRGSGSFGRETGGGSLPHTCGDGIQRKMSGSMFGSCRIELPSRLSDRAHARRPSPSPLRLHALTLQVERKAFEMDAAESRSKCAINKTDRQGLAGTEFGPLEKQFQRAGEANQSWQSNRRTPTWGDARRHLWESNASLRASQRRAIVARQCNFQCCAQAWPFNPGHRQCFESAEALSCPLTLVARGRIGDAVKTRTEPARWPPKHEHINRWPALHDLQCRFEIIEGRAARRRRNRRQASQCDIGCSSARARFRRASGLRAGSGV